MRVYTAGFYHAGGMTIPGQGSPEMSIVAADPPPYVLESFFYVSRRLEETLRRQGKTIFLDSGAYSMWTQGVELDIKAYADYLKANSDIIHIAASMDETQRNREQQNYDNWRFLKDAGLDVVPVHHVRDREEWIGRYVEEIGEDEHLFIGGMVPESSRYLQSWLDRVWGQYLTHPDGTPKCKVHGFGLTTYSLMFRYPWWSVDSTSWAMAAAFGRVDVPRKRRTGETLLDLIMVSEEAPNKRKHGSNHFQRMSPPEQKRIREWFAELDAQRNRDPELESWYQKATGRDPGYFPETLANSYGWRRRLNLHGYKMIEHLPTKTFKATQNLLF